MALTLIEYAKGVDEPKSRAIIELFAEMSDFLEVLPFKTAPGGAYRYQQEEALPNMAFRAINETPTVSNGVINEAVEQCFPMAGNLDVDRANIRRFGMERRSREERMKVKKAAQLFTDTALGGDHSSNPREFSGLQTRLVGSVVDGSNYDSRIIANSTGSGGGPLSLAKLDLAIGLTEQPTHLLMSTTMKIKFEAAARSPTISNNQITIDPGDNSELGRQVTRFKGLPILTGYGIDKHGGILPFTEADYGGGGTACTSIYVLSFREDGVCGLETAPMEVTDMGLLDNGVHYRTNVEHDAGMCIEDPYAAMRLSSITNATITA